ncbi:hypothetical protein GH714_018627 [Hevea brasiliensis]|uniref:Uncharacterized protein n=1 Tax=Hevea brasiliensis TaxID=3981 RepID=A0A6A6MJH1_HEVBR|nr:hypothetical protein GH714_018627 [Hevea brasiliensis]
MAETTLIVAGLEEMPFHQALTAHGTTGYEISNNSTVHEVIKESTQFDLDMSAVKENDCGKSIEEETIPIEIENCFGVGEFKEEGVLVEDVTRVVEAIDGDGYFVADDNIL